MAKEREMVAYYKKAEIPSTIIFFSIGTGEYAVHNHHYLDPIFTDEQLEKIYGYTSEHIVAVFRAYPLKQNPFTLNNRIIC